ncbi:MAG: spermidine synthase [Phycisphaerae bacterium]|nr:spermidine synthase [Phycisphaerae bacterium]
MSANFEELDYCRTAIGELSLRRRRVMSMGGAEVYEVKIDNQLLMSSVVNQSEIALAELGLCDLGGTELDVVVGGLGLGYTAAAALKHPGVSSVLVIEYLAQVIGWHERGLVPLGGQLTSNERCRLIHGDFFELASTPDTGFDPHAPGRRFHAILLDIDHSPSSVLHASHAGFYTPDGLSRLVRHLHPGGVLALWSADPPEDDVLRLLDTAFVSANAHPVHFHNPLLNSDDVNTVYVGRTDSGSRGPQRSIEVQDS